MFTRKIVAVAMASSLALGSGAAWAATNAADSVKMSREIVATMAAKKSLADAIRSAEVSAQGKAFEASMETKNGLDVWKVKTRNKDGVTVVTLDPGTGMVTEQHKAGGIWSMLVGDESSESPTVAPKTGLADAVAAAEKKVDGKAVEASMKEDASTPIYGVDVAGTKGGLTHVAVNGATGAVIKTAPAGNSGGEENDESNG